MSPNHARAARLRERLGGQPHSLRARLSGLRVADRRAGLPAPVPAGARVGLRGGQRRPRPARHARGGHAEPRGRRRPQRPPRDVADRLPRGRLRAGPGRPDDRQRDRRHADPALRRRRALRPDHGEAAALRARAGHADRRAQPRGRVGDRARAPDAHPLATPGVAGAPPPGRHGLRGRGPRRRRAHRHLLGARDPRSGRGRRR